MAPAPAARAGPPPDLSDSGPLEDRWGTAVYLLRSPQLSDAGALSRTRRAAEDGCAYVREVKETSARLGIRSGALSKMLLPYGEETSTLEQAHASNVAEYARLEQLDAFF